VFTAQRGPRPSITSEQEHLQVEDIKSDNHGGKNITHRKAQTRRHSPADQAVPSHVETVAETVALRSSSSKLEDRHDQDTTQLSAKFDDKKSATTSLSEDSFSPEDTPKASPESTGKGPAPERGRFEVEAAGKAKPVGSLRVQRTRKRNSPKFLAPAVAEPVQGALVPTQSAVSHGSVAKPAEQASARRSDPRNGTANPPGPRSTLPRGFKPYPNSPPDAKGMQNASRPAAPSSSSSLLADGISPVSGGSSNDIHPDPSRD
jgi:hypothetical protein